MRNGKARKLPNGNLLSMEVAVNTLTRPNLTSGTINLQQDHSIGYRAYHSNSQQCLERPFLDQCMRCPNHIKVITQHMWQDSVDRMDARRLTVKGKQIYQRCNEWWSAVLRMPNNYTGIVTRVQRTVFMAATC